jgi:hypothetical protein
MFKLTKEELVKILCIAYEEGCYGYIDLRDSVVERLIGEIPEEDYDLKWQPYKIMKGD